MQDWVAKFLSFDRLIGLQLTKAMYYLGLVVIIGYVLWTMLTALGHLFGDFFYSLGQLIGAPIAGLLAIVLWRLVSERTYIYFRDNVGDETAPHRQDEVIETGFTLDPAEEAGA